MEIFGVGPLELGFILLIALLVIGPKDLPRVALTLGTWLNQLNRSETFLALRQFWAQLRQAPDALMHYADVQQTPTPPPPPTPPPTTSPTPAWVPQGTVGPQENAGASGGAPTPPAANPPPSAHP